MSRRANHQHRCRRCRMHQSLCICADMPRLALESELVVVIHRSETLKTTNTGTLAAACLSRAHVLVHGDKDVHVEPPDFRGRTPLLLFPSDDAVPLSRALVREGPLSLVVPDSSWRQADKMCARIPFMRTLPRVTLAGSPSTSYRLRSEPRRGGLATMEAIAYALGVIEGDEVERALLHVFRLMVERTLFSRGLLAREQVYGGLASHVRVDRPWQTGDEAVHTPVDPGATRRA